MRYGIAKCARPQQNAAILAAFLMSCGWLPLTRLLHLMQKRQRGRSRGSLTAARRTNQIVLNEIKGSTRAQLNVFRLLQCAASAAAPIPRYETVGGVLRALGREIRFDGSEHGWQLGRKKGRTNDPLPRYR
jgi:hypothetical protein